MKGKIAFGELLGSGSDKEKKYAPGIEDIPADKIPIFRECKTVLSGNPCACRGMCHEIVGFRDRLPDEPPYEPNTFHKFKIDEG